MIRAPGTQNRLAGPDLFNTKVEIDGRLWAGNVEMHLKSSNWYVHHHEMDGNYNNVIFHGVWKGGIAVFRKDGPHVPTLEAKRYVSQRLLEGYRNLMDGSRINFINCEKNLKDVAPFLVENRLRRLYIER